MVTNFVSIVGDLIKFDYDAKNKTIQLDILTENGEDFFNTPCNITLAEDNKELFDKVARLKKTIFKSLRIEGMIDYSESMSIDILNIEVIGEYH